MIIRSGNCGKLLICQIFYTDTRMILRIMYMMFFENNHGGKLWKML